MKKRKAIIKRDNFGIIPFIVLSVIFHGLFFWIFFGSKTKQDFFVQVPFEVSFYSPVENKAKTKVFEKKKKIIEEIKKEEIKESKITKDDIVIKKEKNKKKKEPKKQVEKKIKQPVVESKPQVQVQAQQKGIGSQEVFGSKGVMFENKNFKYSYYTNTIVKKIRKYWQWSETTEIYRAVVYFKILKDGSIDEVKIKESSKNEEFDQNVIRAVRLAGPFAPLPSGYNESYLGVYFEFKFN